MKGLAISNSDLIKNVHNSYKKPDWGVDWEGKAPAKEDDDVYHFISYVPYKKKLYELDGLQKGPVVLSSFEGEDDWIEHAKNEIN